MRSIRDNISAKRFSAIKATTCYTTQNPCWTTTSNLHRIYWWRNPNQNLLRPGGYHCLNLVIPLWKRWSTGVIFVMLNIFSGWRLITQRPYKFIVFYEAHKYMDTKDLTGSIVTAIAKWGTKFFYHDLQVQDPWVCLMRLLSWGSIVCFAQIQ